MDGDGESCWQAMGTLLTVCRNKRGLSWGGGGGGEGGNLDRTRKLVEIPLQYKEF